MRWIAKQYDKVWTEIYESCDDDTRDVLDSHLDLLERNGSQSDRPISAPLGDGIFELRAKNVRMLFYFGKNRDIIFVHGIIKKVRKVPREDIELAKKRRKEYTNRVN